MYCRNLRALAAYCPTLDGGNPERMSLHLLRASETNGHLQAYPGHNRNDFGWGQIEGLSSRMRISLYSGDHFTVIRDAGARDIGRLISSILVNVQASRQSRSWKSIFVSSEAKSLRSVPAPRIRMPHSSNDFRISSGTSKSFEDDSAKCTQDAYGEFVARSGCMPTLILVTASPNVDPNVVVAALQQMAPEARIQAVSSVSSALCNNGSAKVALLGE